MRLPGYIEKILHALRDYDAYIVGGCVRDFLRGEVPKDWDVATNATPGQVQNIFKKTIATGEAHGTITVLEGGQHIEVTTFRLDGNYSDGRRPDSVVFSQTIEEDLARRDFTMNAIAYCPQRGYVDPYNGRADIESRIVRAVGDAKSRFTEDALRMLRAVRFACTLGFSVCENAVKAMRELAKNLENVSQERVRDELGKMLTGEHIHNMKMLETCGLLAQIFRNGYSGDFQLALQRAANAPRNEAMRLALFLSHETSETAAETLRSLRYDNRTISAVAGYISNIHGETSAERADVKRLLRSLGADMYDTLLVLREICGDKPAIIALAREQARDIVASGEPYTMAHLAVDGRDLASIGYKPTPEMGAELEHLLEIVTNEPTKNKRDILLKMAASRL